MSGSFTVEITEQSILDFGALHRRNLKWSLLAIMAGIGVLLGVLIRRSSVANGNAPPLWAHIVAITLICAVIYGVAMLLGRIHFRYWARRYFRQQVSLHHPANVVWDEDGISIATPIDQSQRRWTDFVCWRANDRILLIYQSLAIANIFPMTGENAAQIDGIIAALERAGVKQRGWR